MTTEQTPLPESKLEARKGEGVLLVAQNNHDKTVTITAMNERLEVMLGYAAGEVIGRKIEAILGVAEAQAMADELEYADTSPDFGDIFSRRRELRLRRRVGDEIRVECTVSRLLSDGAEARFQLVIPNELERLAGSKLKDFLALNLEGRCEVDPATNLPNYETAKAFLPLLKNYMADSGTNVLFAVLRLDRYEKSLALYGKDACAKLLLHAAHCCRASFRANDILFALSDRTIGVLLFDISRESGRVVLNRLRWKIRSHRLSFAGKSSFSITTSLAFNMLDVDSADGLLEQCCDAVAAIDAGERNALVELGVV